MNQHVHVKIDGTFIIKFHEFHSMFRHNWCGGICQVLHHSQRRNGTCSYFLISQRLTWRCRFPYLQIESTDARFATAKCLPPRQRLIFAGKQLEDLPAAVDSSSIIFFFPGCIFHRMAVLCQTTTSRRTWRSKPNNQIDGKK